MNHWDELNELIKKYKEGNKAGFNRIVRMCRALDIPTSTLDNYFHKTAEPSYSRGMMLKNYLENPPPDPKPKPKKKYYKKKKQKTEMKTNKKIKRIEENPILKTITFEEQREDETYFQFIKRTGQIL